jgi:hypothetical protein
MNVRPISIRSDQIIQKGSIICLHIEDNYGCLLMYINSKTSFLPKGNSIQAQIYFSSPLSLDQFRIQLSFLQVGKARYVTCSGETGVNLRQNRVGNSGFRETQTPRRKYSRTFTARQKRGMNCEENRG